MSVAIEASLRLCAISFFVVISRRFSSSKPSILCMYSNGRRVDNYSDLCSIDSIGQYEWAVMRLCMCERVRLIL